jgi:DNA (cytosine-5)-methyltransferase 1
VEVHASRHPDGFTYADLFAGIGGFHAALSSVGGTCRFVSEIDPAAAAVYERNWGPSIRPDPGRPIVEGDIIPLTEDRMCVPPTDVVVGGFPCQPFSKSGRQLGMGEARGTLFWNICRILEAHRPSVVLLENVRNIAGPRHRHEWEVIIRTLRSLGYEVSDTPTVFSPHLLPPHLGGTPQVRERVFIAGVQVGKDAGERATDVGPVVEYGPVAGWNPDDWDLDRHLLLSDDQIDNVERYRLSDEDQRRIAMWDEFLSELLAAGVPLPGGPVWAEYLAPLDDEVMRTVPKWRTAFIPKNAALYDAHSEMIDAWKTRHSIEDVPPSRRRLEWQAGNSAKSMWDTVMQMRPSGIRAKRANILPALVAINQTSIIGWRRRVITPREAARLQGLPDWFDFGDQPDSVTYRQLGNGVAVGAVRHVFRQLVTANAHRLPERLVLSVLAAPGSPEVVRP